MGNYVITPAGLTSPNYAIIFNPGTFTISAPAPVILSLTRTGAADITLNLSAVIGATYRVQYDSDLNGTNWTDLDGDVLASGGTASKTDTFMGTNRYYRIHVIP